MRITRLNNHGATMIEASLVLILLTGIFIASLNAISFGVARMWLEHCLYSANRCQLTDRKDCARQTKQKINILTWGHIEQFNMSRHQDHKKFEISESRLLWCNSNERKLCKKENTIRLQMTMREKDLAVLR